MFFLAQIAENSKLDERINTLFAPIAKLFSDIIFVETPVGGGLSIPVVLILLAFTALFLTIWYKFLNLRLLKAAFKTISGKYTSPDSPGQITHFQALSAALSATVGLGNIAGVAIAIGIGGPGATFWMVLMGLLGMTTKFCECTLGVKYRKIDSEGSVHGGAMYYLSGGFKELGWEFFGKVLAVFFAITCIFAAFGAGGMFQVNQSYSQFYSTFGLIKEGWVFGLIIAILVAIVIIGGIRSIATVAEFIVPIMCFIYITASLVIIFLNLGKVPDAVATIIKEAFYPSAFWGGNIGLAFIWGVRRAAFSNEAGVGSAPIAHSAVKTKHPASEGLVALLEPFIDTVIVCSMTALVIVITGIWKVNAVSVEENKKIFAYEETNVNSQLAFAITPDDFLRKMAQFPKPEKGKKIAKEELWYQVVKVKNENIHFDKNAKRGWVPASQIELKSGTKGGIWLTSKAFESKISWFPKVLTVAVILFAFSTMISWSYYGEQAIIYLFGNHKATILSYKFLFCAFLVVGAASKLSSVLDFSDAMFFAMIFPNLIGLYFLMPKISAELKSYKKHIAEVDAKD